MNWVFLLYIAVITKILIINKMNKKMIKKILIPLFLVIILLSQFGVFITPINRHNIESAKEECRIFSLLNNYSEKYVTREEFLEAILRVMGLNDNLMLLYSELVDGSFPTSDFNDESYKNSNVRDIFRYFILCDVAQQNNIMQAYFSRNGKSNEYRYKGKEYISFHDALVMIQACVSNVDTDNGMFEKNSLQHYKLLLNSHSKGVLNWTDLGYWSLFDTKLTRDELCVLLSRMLEQKRYHYILDIDNANETIRIDENRNLTYKEFLLQENEYPLPIKST